MNVALPEPVSIALHRYGHFEPELTSMVIEYLKPGGVFFDIGTHFGYFTLLASSIVGAGGAVHSFEPTPSTFKVLQSNVRDLPNVKAFNLAMYSQEMEIPFNDYGVAYSAFNSLFAPRLSAQEAAALQTSKVMVQITTVDRHIESTGVRPTFVKIDAESAELAILEGMERTIAQVRPIISVEVGDVDIEGVADSKDLVKRLLDRGYRALEHSEGQIREHRMRERYEYDNILFIPQ